MEEGEEEEEGGSNDLALLSMLLFTTTTQNTRGREEGGEIDGLLLPSLNGATTKVLLRRWRRADGVCFEACKAQQEGGGGVKEHLDNLVATLTMITTSLPPPCPPDPIIVGNHLVGGGYRGEVGERHLRSAIPTGYERDHQAPGVWWYRHCRGHFDFH